MQEEIIFKDRIGPEQSSKYKCKQILYPAEGGADYIRCTRWYVLHQNACSPLLVDGNGWSSRFNRLLMSGSVVLKTTIYPEWNSVRQIRNS